MRDFLTKYNKFIFILLVIILVSYLKVDNADAIISDTKIMGISYNKNKSKDIQKLVEDYGELQNKIIKEENDISRIKNVTYDRNNITIISNITEEEMREVLLNTMSASTMEHLAKAFVEGEKSYNVNAFTMAAIVALESGYATSRRAIEDNNLTGFEVYSDSSKGKMFNSQDESVLQTAKHLSENYLKENGKYYNGLSVDAVQVKYCPDEGKNKRWEDKVHILADRFLETYNELYKSKYIYENN